MIKEILQDTACLREDEIKRYLAEKSPQEEIRRVENHLLDCPFCTDALEGLEGYYSFETDKDLEQLHAALSDQAPVSKSEGETKIVAMQSRNRLFTLNRIAATILLLVLPAAAWFYINNNSPTRVPEFGTNEVVRSGGEVADENAAARFKVISLYEAEQYEAALAAAQAMLAVNLEDVKTTYYAGLSAYKAGEYNLAADYFMTVRLNSDSYYEEATWMEAQSHVGAKDTLNAILLLDGIAEKKDGYYYKDAVALRERLN
jgi:tetratricopeptide (TPR) repeat protein